MGKITVEIKKSTFGKPLHNFDHPTVDEGQRPFHNEETVSIYFRTGNNSSWE